MAKDFVKKTVFGVNSHFKCIIHLSNRTASTVLRSVIRHTGSDESTKEV